MEKKTWEKPGSVGGQFPSGQTNQQFVPTAATFSCKGSTGSSGSYPDVCLGDESPHWRSVSGAHLGVPGLHWCFRDVGAWEVVLGADPPSDLDMDWICWLQWSSGLDRTGSGGYGDLRIRKKKTNISVDVILLTM